MVCGFLSPGEKELERRLRATSGTRWIKTMAQGLPLHFDPTVEDSRYLAAHRQLLLSALPVGAPFDWATCHAMNDHAAAMCRRARGEEARRSKEANVKYRSYHRMQDNREFIIHN